MAARHSRGAYKIPPHIALIANTLVEASIVGGMRILITLPPRHGKSELCSHRFPVWYLDRFPDRRIILASYAADYASEWGRKVRNTMEEHSDTLRTRLAPDSKAANRWNTTQHGGMFTAGIGGPATGRGANILLIDDPVKNWEEAYSATARQRAWDWWLSTAYTRLEPNASVVAIQTRWHEDDWAGRILEEQAKGKGDDWIHIRLPALAEANDPLGRAEGEALWPARYTREDLLKIMRVVGPLVWGGLFQQDPLPSDSILFPRESWQTYTFPPPLKLFDSLLMSWDATFKDLKTSSFVVGQAWGFLAASAYLLAQSRGRMNFTETLRQMLALYKRFPMAGAILVEDKANGPAILNMLRNKLPGLVPITPKGSKEARASAIQPFVLAGNVWIPDPERVGWAKEFVDECRAFPGGKNDDQVDAMSQGLSYQWLTGGYPVGDVDFDLDYLHEQKHWTD